MASFVLGERTVGALAFRVARRPCPVRAALHDFTSFPLRHEGNRAASLDEQVACNRESSANRPSTCFVIRTIEAHRTRIAMSPRGGRLAIAAGNAAIAPDEHSPRPVVRHAASASSPAAVVLPNHRLRRRVGLARIPVVHLRAQ
ncbi:hypothetical protein, partial [Burkholderia sp. ABCPW 111]|uniref:hypothetical protein n=1 Tax=Burkholderia sp. ABCPW 111 TaxID=1820025 RepID=UPI00126A5938